MTCIEAITNRYTYRGNFIDKPMPKEDLDTILTAGIAAPIGMSKQTMRYIAVTSPEMLAKMRGLTEQKAWNTAPVLIVMISQNIVMPNGMCFEIENYSAAAENMLLAVTATGYATVWNDGMTRRPAVQEVLTKLFPLAENETIRAILPIGIPETPGEIHEKDKIEDLVTFC